MATTTTDAKLGGLPATKFLNRQIKVKWDDREQHHSSCKCIAVEGSYLVVAVTGGRSPMTRRVPLSKCKPWWTQNPDLKAEAEALGSLFTGEVSLGRAFAKAEEQTTGKSPVPVDAYVQVPSPTLKVTLPPQHKSPEPPPILDITHVPKPPVEQTPSPKPPPATTPVAKLYRTPVRVEVPVTGDGSWMEDMREYYALRASFKSSNEELDKLRAKIKELQNELCRKLEEQLHTEEETQTMLDLFVEQLEAKGVVFHWEGEAAPPAKAIPQKETDEFANTMRAWVVAHQHSRFTFADLFNGIHEEDTNVRRHMVKRYCRKLGMTVESHRGPGAKTTIIPKA